MVLLSGFDYAAVWSAVVSEFTGALPVIITVAAPVLGLLFVVAFTRWWLGSQVPRG